MRHRRLILDHQYASCSELCDMLRLKYRLRPAADHVCSPRGLSGRRSPGLVPVAMRFDTVRHHRSDLHLVADVYSDAASGSHAPILAVERRFGISRSTAGRWVARPRKAGLLEQVGHGQCSRINWKSSLSHGISASTRWPCGLRSVGVLVMTYASTHTGSDGSACFAHFSIRRSGSGHSSPTALTLVRCPSDIALRRCRA
jgi:hypothetical protein